MKQLIGHAVALAAVLALSACSSSSSGGGSTPDGGGSSEPTISIMTPAMGASVMVTKPNDTMAIQFTTANFTLAAPGTCPANLQKTDNCGHIHVLVDGPSCTPEGSPYDNDATASPATAILSTCPTVNTMHTAKLELHHDDHSPVVVSGATVSASVMFTATGG